MWNLFPSEMWELIFFYSILAIASIIGMTILLVKKWINKKK